MNSDTPQGIDAVEYGRVLEYPKRRKKSQMAVGSKPKEGEKGKKNLYLWF